MFKAVATVLLTVATASMANASFSSEECTNAYTTVKLTNDRGLEKLEIGINVSEKGSVKTRFVTVPDAIVETLEDKEIERSIEMSCEGKKPGDFAYGIAKRTSVVKIKATRKGDREFPGTKYGRSAGKVIETRLICQSAASIPASCP